MQKLRNSYAIVTQKLTLKLTTAPVLEIQLGKEMKDSS